MLRNITEKITVCKRWGAALLAALAVSAGGALLFMLPVVLAFRPYFTPRTFGWMGLWAATEIFFLLCAYRGLEWVERFFHRRADLGDGFVRRLADICALLCVAAGAFLVSEAFLWVSPFSSSGKAPVLLSFEAAIAGVIGILLRDHRKNCRLQSARQRGWQLLRRGLFPHAEQAFEKALRLCGRYAGLAPYRYGRQLAACQNDAGLLYKMWDQPDKAETHFLAAVERYESLAATAYEPCDLDLACAYNNLGALYAEQKRYDCAEKYLGKAVWLCEHSAPEMRLPCMPESENERAIRENLHLAAFRRWDTEWSKADHQPCSDDKLLLPIRKPENDCFYYAVIQYKHGVADWQFANASELREWAFSLV